MYVNQEKANVLTNGLSGLIVQRLVKRNDSGGRKEMKAYVDMEKANVLTNGLNGLYVPSLVKKRG